MQSSHKHGIFIYKRYSVQAGGIMNSNVKAVTAMTFLVLGLFTGTNYMVDKEDGMNSLMWTILFFVGAGLLWIWITREERGAEEAAEESLDAAEEALRRLETQAAPAPSVEPQVEVVEESDPVAESSSEPDDLTQVDGIGPKSAEILAAAGIDTFAKLAAMSEDAIVETIRKGGGRKSASMNTWAKQAKSLAKG
jgi:predicted flap endonuclease-1-like 5' DNA nuclease